MGIIYDETTKTSQLHLENEDLHVVILPEIGGKIISFRHKKTGFELAMPNPGRGYSIPGDDARFTEFDASGLDECFPTIDKCDFDFQGDHYDFPDHGEIWSHPMEVEALDGNSCVLCYRSERFPYIYRRFVRMEGEKLLQHYEITNTSGKDFPCIWTTHGLIRWEKDMKIRIPKGIETFLNLLDNYVLGESQKVYALKNDTFDFSGVPEGNPPMFMKWYGQEAVTEGKSGVEYPSQNMVMEMEWDEKLFPWFGVWITSGLFKGEDYTAALEPCNSYYDDLRIAKKYDRLGVVPADSVMKFDLVMTLKELNA